MKLSDKNTDSTTTGEIAAVYFYISLRLSPSLPGECNMYIYEAGAADGLLFW